MRGVVARVAAVALIFAPSAAVGLAPQRSTPVPVARQGTAAVASGGKTPVVAGGQTAAQTGTQTGAHDSVSLGDRIVRAGTSVRGPVVVAVGDLEVRGTIEGSAITLLSDIIVVPGGRITGDAVAIFGTVRVAGGSVGGASRSFSSAFGAAMQPPEASAPAPRPSTSDALRLALGWLVVLLLIGIGVLVFAGSYLEGVVDVLEQSFWRSLWIGIAGELALLPVLVLLCVGLAITVLGILLVPFAVVAFVLAALGLFTLGFLAIARLTGHSIGSSAADRLSARGSALRGIVVGVLLYIGLWVLAAAFTWLPIVSTIVRAVAIAVTWVATTAGFGAAILSRGGTRRDVEAVAPSAAADQVGWQTPTPVTGIVAARRPGTTLPRDRAS